VCLIAIHQQISRTLISMCGRFTRTRPVADYAGHFHAEAAREDAPDFNVSPSDEILAVTAEPDRSRYLVWLHWGLVPSWSKGPDSRFSMINARAETVRDKPAFRTPFKKRRCLIAADGFYEWRQTSQGKQPYYITLKSGEPIAMAGLWDHWESQSGDRVISSSVIITTRANRDMEPLHERMPVILHADAHDAWLDPGNSDTDQLSDFLVPLAPGLIEYYPVSKRVNSPTHDSPELIKPVRLEA